MGGIPDGSGVPPSTFHTSSDFRHSPDMVTCMQVQMHSTLATAHLNRSLSSPHSWYPGANSEAIGTQGHVQPEKLVSR